MRVPCRNSKMHYGNVGIQELVSMNKILCIIADVT